LLFIAMVVAAAFGWRRVVTWAVDRWEKRQ
jgi:hypothetical protein